MIKNVAAKKLAIAVLALAFVAIGGCAPDSDVPKQASEQLPLEFNRFDERPHLLMFRSNEEPHNTALRHWLEQYAASHYGFVYVSSDVRIFSIGFLKNFDVLLLHADEFASLPHELRSQIARGPVQLIVTPDRLVDADLGKRLRRLLAVH